MTRKPIAIDAMGGDVGLTVNVEGSVRAVKDDDQRVVLVGDETQLKAELTRLGASLDDPALEHLAVRHAPEVIEMDEKPAAAVRKKKGSSMRVACELVKAGEAAGAISIGNSGAMMAVALLVHGRLKGVLRPCIATAFPSQGEGISVLADAGANVDCTPEMLFQFGLMASVYLERAYGMKEPSVGVLANGTEPGKGTELTRGAVALLEQTELNFLGHIEPGQLTRGVVRVGVTDGFTGNLMLKTGEAAAKMITDAIRKAFMEAGPIVKLAGAVSKGSLRSIGAMLDPREFGAAPLLGLRAPAFIGHGSSDAYAVQTAIRRASTHIEHDVTAGIADAIAQWKELSKPSGDQVSKQA